MKFIYSRERLSAQAKGFIRSFNPGDLSEGFKMVVSPNAQTLIPQLKNLKDLNATKWAAVGRSETPLFAIRYLTGRKNQFGKPLEYSLLADCNTILDNFNLNREVARLLEKEGQKLCLEWNQSQGKANQAGARSVEAVQWTLGSIVWKDKDGRPQATKLMLKIDTFAYTSLTQDWTRDVECTVADLGISLKFKSTVGSKLW